MPDTQTNLESLKFRRTMFICFAYAMAFIGGLSAVVSRSGITEFLLSWISAFTLVIAVALDARIVGKPVPRIIQLIMVFTWPVSIPICLIWTRKWKGLLWIFVYGITLLILYQATAMIIYFVIETRSSS